MNHSWKEIGRFPRKTERECTRGCGTIKVTLHPDGRGGRRHIVEFYRDGEKIECEGTPECAPIAQPKETEACP